MYLCWKSSGGIDYPANYLIILAMKDVDLKKVMKAVFACGFVGLSYGFTWFFMNAPDKLTTVKDYGRGMIEVRYKFCTWHANHDSSYDHGFDCLVFYMLIIRK